MRVLIVDDHALFRVGLEGLLERRGLRVVGAAAEGEEGLRLARTLNPDVVLLDLRMPELGGLSVLRHMVEQGLDIPVVMLTTSADEGDLSESLRNGARGYLLKDMEPDELVLALQEIIAGKIVVAPALTSVLADLVRHGERRERKDDMVPFSSLTPREHEILCHLSEGQSNKVIARHLDISDGTVKLHVKAILRKLGVHSRVEAAVMAVEKGVRNRSGRE
ncbi:MAG: two-component system response regulator NarL [Acidiferrobacteraceae bacterium]|jgi:two-component system nitrate/nitrite response regulator NarL|nr:two-component system response regulator NarL [Acidiferrobacteraceae bacterium]MDP6551363.1 response regulator [Arenicellales bacterium]MDP6792173.1 response regulator [Arenicellales bacterium]MDP6919927.1 response regulator [Arenicellales bacterium]|tara:strand:- start:381 stop:1040 length:660 start_codon:yes stop_codon:yes gene_type:complete